MIDFTYLVVTALVSLFMTVLIVFMMDVVRPDLITSKAGTSVFIYIGVFAGNLIMEVCRRRLEKRR